MHCICNLQIIHESLIHVDEVYLLLHFQFLQELQELHFLGNDTFENLILVVGLVSFLHFHIDTFKTHNFESARVDRLRHYSNT